MKPIRSQFADTMLSVGCEDASLVVVVGDISHFKMIPFAEKHPDRFYNIGICEPSMISLGAGLSKVGLTPVLHTIAPFILERSLEQLKLDFGYHKLGGNIVTVGSAFDYSNLGCTHHCYNDFSLFKTIEDSEITQPGTAEEFDILFRQTYRSPHLTLFRVPELSHDVSIDPSKIKFSRAVKLCDGKDITIIATGPQLSNAMAAQRRLAERHIGCDVLYVHTIRPLDTEAIYSSVSKTKHVLVVEEHFEYGGLGDDVLRVIKDISGFKHSSLSIPNRYVREYGTYQQLCQSLKLSPQGVFEAAEELLKR